MTSTQFGFLMSKCAIALLCCAFSIEPLFAQEVDWLSNGNDVSNSRFQSIDQINLSNVSQLKEAWVFHTGSPGVNMQVTPVVADGVMYITDGLSDVFALNPTTGKQIWKYTPSPALAAEANRGVVYGRGMVVIGRNDNMLVALNAKTGAVVWQTAVDVASDFTHLSAAPQFVNASNGAGGTVAEVVQGIAS